MAKINGGKSGEMTFAVFKDLCFSQEPGEMEYNEFIRGA